MVIFTVHARVQMTARGIPESMVLESVERPQQTIPINERRPINQSRYFDHSEGKEMMLRVFVEPLGDDVIVVSVYRTSRINKYWISEF